MRVITIRQTEWFRVDIEDDELSDEEAIAAALQDGDAWVSSGHLEVDVLYFEKDGVFVKVVDY